MMNPYWIATIAPIWAGDRWVMVLLPISAVISNITCELVDMGWLGWTWTMRGISGAVTSEYITRMTGDWIEKRLRINDIFTGVGLWWGYQLGSHEQP